jgi:hypothetical protein
MSTSSAWEAAQVLNFCAEIHSFLAYRLSHNCTRCAGPSNQPLEEPFWCRASKFTVLQAFRTRARMCLKASGLHELNIPMVQCTRCGYGRLRSDQLRVHLPVLKWCVGIGNEKRVPDKRLFKVQSCESCLQQALRHGRNATSKVSAWALPNHASNAMVIGRKRRPTDRRDPRLEGD